MENKKWSLLIIGLCLLSLVVGIVNTSVNFKQTYNEESKSERRIDELFAKSKLAVITLTGAIDSSPDRLSPKKESAKSVKDALIKAIDDKNVKGVLLRVNSPGGTVGMSQEIYRTILKLRKEKPVVVSICDIAASGGYYIASAADRIYANEGSLTGSIGVIMGTLDFHKVMQEKIGITSNTIKSGKFKDMGSPYRAMTGDEKKLLQNIINTTYMQFVGAIRKGRMNREDKYSIEKTTISEVNLKKYADGRIFSGEQALTYGFVDKLGGMEEAKDALQSMAREKYNLSSLRKLPFSDYNQAPSFKDLLYELSEASAPSNLRLDNMIPFSSRYPHQPLLIWE